MPKYTVVLLRHEDMGGEPYIAYVDSESGSKAVKAAREEVFAADKKDGLHEDLFVKPQLSDYRALVVFTGHPDLVYLP